MSSTTSNFTSSSPEKGCLFPGYKYVEQFGPDDEYEEDEEEECYVTLDLANADQTLVPSSSSYRLICLDTPNPLLQLSRTIMKGHVQTLIGTELIFEDISEETDSPSQSNIQYVAKTDRRIQFREVELKPKSKPEGNSGEVASKEKEKPEQPPSSSPAPLEMDQRELFIPYVPADNVPADEGGERPTSIIGEPSSSNTSKDSDQPMEVDR